MLVSTVFHGDSTCVRKLISTVHHKYLYYGANNGNLEYFTAKHDAYVLEFW